MDMAEQMAQAASPAIYVVDDDDSVRGAVLHVGRLDDIEQDLTVEAVRVTGDSGTVLYDFSLWAGERLLVEGRAAIVLDVAMPDFIGVQS